MNGDARPTPKRFRDNDSYTGTLLIFDHAERERMSIDTGVRVSPLAWLRGQLGRYTYRPGWTLEIEPEPGPASFAASAGRLVISFRETDSRDPNQTTRVRSTNMIPIPIAEMFDEALFAIWLQRMLFDVEMHESREWLRRDGQIYDDPHA